MGEGNREGRKRGCLCFLSLGNDNDNDNGNGGNVGGGAFVVGAGGEESEVECGIGNVATVWDGEIAGIAWRK